MTTPFIPSEKSLRDLEVLKIALLRPTGCEKKDARHAEIVREHEEAVVCGKFIGCFVTDSPLSREIRKQLGHMA
jgi:hypothetical protein